ncbi:MAG: molybdenum cofactor guanylyltransferase [Woeseiaceae bacterium]
MTKNEPVNGLVLAGGRSKRMGQDKALLRVDGETQLSRAVHLLGPFVDQVFVSTRVDQQDEPERSKFRQIVDRYRELGPLAGILSAMEEHPDAGWLVLACDLPNVEELTIRYLLDNRSAVHPFTAYKSSSDGLPEPLCAFYSAGGAAIVKAFADDGIICPRKILIGSDTHLLEQPNPEALDNINTPEDLAGTGIKIAS